MSGMLNALRAAADYGRRATDALGIRTVTVSIVRKTYSAAFGTAGATLVSTTTTPLVPNPKVTANAEGPATAMGGGTEAGSTGVLRAAQYVIGPITRTYSGGGYTQAQLLLTPASPSERVYLLLDDGGDQFTAGGEKFDVIACDVSRPLRTMLIVQRADQT